MITTKPYKPVSDKDSDLQLAMSDFPGEQDSEILVRERARGTKLDGLYKKRKRSQRRHRPTNKKQEGTQKSHQRLPVGRNLGVRRQKNTNE